MGDKTFDIDLAAVQLFSSTFYTLLNGGISTDDAIDDAIKVVEAFYNKFK